MKRKCKNIDITDPNVIRPWVVDCIKRHKKRYDFRDMLLAHGVTKEIYDEVLVTYNMALFDNAIDLITQKICEIIKSRTLSLPAVHIREQQDKTTGKIRLIGCESPMQQILDYVAVYSSMDVFKKRMVIQQCSSVPGRGQVYGMNMIKNYVRRDNRALRYVKKHPQRHYTSKCSYVVKLDVKKCFPSANFDVFINLFKRDCANQDIIWLWSELLKSHNINGYQGFMIGALISQWACQYMLSFLYHKAMSIKYKSHSKQYKSVTHMVMFMDDMVLFGTNRLALLKAIRVLIKYAVSFLKFKLKENFAICKFNQVDMMGYVIYRKGTVAMRGRNYIKSRRLKFKYDRTGSLSLRQCRRIVSYKGFYVHSDWKKYKLRYLFLYAQNVINKEEQKKWKEQHTQNNLNESVTCSMMMEVRR